MRSRLTLSIGPARVVVDHERDGDEPHDSLLARRQPSGVVAWTCRKERAKYPGSRNPTARPTSSAARSVSTSSRRAAVIRRSVIHFWTGRPVLWLTIVVRCPGERFT